MEHIFNLIEMDSSNSRIKSSITESTMMQILHKAMDKAYRKVKSKNGVLERLDATSKFYELAVIQLEGCLTFVHNETDNCVLDSRHEVLIEDLTEIRDRLQGRLKEVEMAISDKDKELLESSGNELKLKKALEISEKELDSLHADLKSEQKKTEGIEDFFLGNQASTDNGDREGEFCELKHSVDQQVWNIQQQLEPNYQLIDEETSQGIESRKIEQMGSDISILKETLDVAFCKMQNAIFLSEHGPIEHQWMWNIERCTAAIVIKGALKDFRENFQEEVKKIEMQVSVGLRKHLSDVMREMTCLNHELELLSFRDGPVESSKAKGSLKAKERYSSVGESFGDSSNFSLKVDDESTIKQPCNKYAEDDNSHYVAKMIKNHESIIRKKSEELNILTRELLREKTCPPLGREKHSVNPKRRIQEVMMNLESLINWSPGIVEIFDDNGSDCEVEKHTEVRLFKDDQMDIEKSGIDSMEEVWAKMNKTSFSQAANGDQCSEMRMLKQEMEDANLQTLMMEETYLTLFKSLVDEFHIEMLNHHLYCLIKEGMYEKFIEEISFQWSKKTESDRIEVQSREQKYDIVYRKAMKNHDSAHNSKAAAYQNAKAESNCPEDRKYIGLVNLEGMLKEDVFTFLLQEILGEWNENIESCMSVSSLEDELCFIVFGETIRDIMNIANNALSKLQEIKVHDNSNYDFQFSDKIFESAAGLIKDDIWMVLLANMIKELEIKLHACSFESLIREEVLLFVIVEAVKGAYVLQEADDRNQEQSSTTSLSVDKLSTNLAENGKENLTRTLDRIAKFLEEEEILILGACSETKEQRTCLELLVSLFDELHEHKHFQGLFSNKQSKSNSANSKLEKALQQLESGKALFSELGSQRGITVATTDCRKPFIYQEKDVEEVQINIYESLLNPIQELSQKLKSFECTSCTRLERHTLRLDEIKHQLDLVTELTTSFIQKESLYRKAFIRRCENLQMAETEVDILGDQVDLLQGLLKKIYVTLQRQSPLLQQYFEVSEMLKIIEKEL